ncbi:MAG TPA: hypothetical protein VG820_08870, partial [Fimbriimonadaceae bacterium]|nr:hypothetical protein [Fimbriimonadaceae bacterium]
NQFQLANYSVVGTDPARMNGFLCDYLMFDISNFSVSDQPPFPDSSGNATAFFIDGDNFAIGTLPPGAPDQAPPDPVPFYVLTPIGYIQGSGVGPRTAINPDTGQSTVIPGTYSVVQSDPRDPLNPATMITALEGTYNRFTKTINSVGQNPQGFEVIAFPSTRDDGFDDIVCFNYVGGTITKLYFGHMDMNTGEIQAWPVAQVTNASDVTNEIDGTVTNMDSTDVTKVKSGHYTFGATNLPATFSATGRFIVYRR